jgi:hypothetical protein
MSQLKNVRGIVIFKNFVKSQYLTAKNPHNPSRIIIWNKYDNPTPIIPSL